MILFFLFFILPLPLLIWLFIRSQSSKAKWLIGIAMVLFVAFVSFAGLSFWAMDVEDLYGDKQEIFWEGSSGDTAKLVDNYTKEILATSILKKTWHRINVQTNGKEIDISKWIENEVGDAFIETRNEIKNGVVTMQVLHPQDQSHFIGTYPDPNTLELNWIGEKLLKYKLKAICEHQILLSERGFAKIQSYKKDTLIFKNSVDDNNLIISVWGEKGRRKAKIFRKGDGINADLEALDYDEFWEK